jgi:DNA-binding PadR family transcriptional regulator
MKETRLPALTHLQFLILSVLLHAPHEPGRVVRDTLATFGVRRTAPAFYQLMARLERDGLVEGWYEQITVGDQAVTERRYRITRAGAARWEDTRQFYDRTVPAALHRRWSNG